MTTRPNAWMVVAILLAGSTAQGTTIFVDVNSCDSNCCIANGTPGCDDPKCEAAVCAIDPFCCDTSWDKICAGEALAALKKSSEAGFDIEPAGSDSDLESLRDDERFIALISK